MRRRRVTIRRTGLAALTLLVAGCASVSLNAWHHVPATAAVAAEAFAQVAFVDDDAEAAFSLLVVEPESGASVERLATAFAQMHPDGHPQSVRATEYEPLPGYRGMNIFLEGRSGTRTYYYRLLMEGTHEDGYHVVGFWRGTGPYPSPERRKPIER